MGGCRQHPFRSLRSATTGQGDDMQFETREDEILRMLMSGLSNLEISGALGIEPDAVKRHMRGILAKLKSKNGRGHPHPLPNGAPAAM